MGVISILQKTGLTGSVTWEKKREPELEPVWIQL